MNTLVIDDNKAVGILVGKQISQLPFSQTTKTVTTYEEAINCHYSEHYDCYVVDVMLNKGKCGLELCKLFKKQNPTASVIVLTGFGNSKVCDAAFEEHIDDFVRKPAMREELNHRIKKAYLNKCSKVSKASTLQYDDLHYCPERNIFQYKRRVLKLTKGQKELLFHLIKKPEELLTKKYLICKLWEDTFEVVDRKRNLRERIYELKKALGTPLKKWIVSKRAEGYILTKKGYHGDK